MLKKSLLITIFSSLTLIPMAALSQTAPKSAPTLSGKYAYEHRFYCQPTIVVTYSGGVVQLINLGTGSGPYGGAGDVDYEAGVADFTLSTLTFSANGIRDDGSPALVQNIGGGPPNQGTPFAEQTSSGGGSYSNTSTTVTLNGHTFNAFYGHVAKGIAQHVALVGLDSNGCSDQWEFDRQ